MSTIGVISVSVTAQTDKFVKGINTVIGRLGALGARAAAMGAAVAGAAAAGLTVLVQRQMEAIDQTAKLSDRLGISTQNLVGYQHAADLAGVSSEQLAGALGKFVKNLPSGSDVGKSFEKTAKDIAAIQDPTDRARVAMEIFGKSGATLIPLLTSNLDEAKAEAIKLGISFDRIDAAKVEAANDNLSRTWEILKGVGTQLAVYVSPYIVGATNNLIAWGTEGEGAGAKIVKVVDFIVSGIANMLDYLDFLVAGWHLVTAGIQAAANVAVGLQVILARTAAAAAFGKSDFLNESAKQLEELRKTYSKAAEESYAAAGKAWDSAMAGTHAAEVEGVFKKWQEDAQAAAEAVKRSVEDATKPGTLTSGVAEIQKFLDEKSKKPKEAKTQELGGFREISSSLISITGLSMMAKKMTVEDPKAHKLLEKIAKNTEDQGDLEATYG